MTTLKEWLRTRPPADVKPSALTALTLDQEALDEIRDAIHRRQVEAARILHRPAPFR